MPPPTFTKGLTFFFFLHSVQLNDDVKIHLAITWICVFRLLQLQWKQDLDLGLELISKAIEIDNKCDFAYETMGTIEVQRYDLKNLSRPLY